MGICLLKFWEGMPMMCWKSAMMRMEMETVAPVYLPMPVTLYFTTIFLWDISELIL